MPSRRHPNYKSRPRYTWQESTFLLLPREIRDLIYFHALTRPTPIDLWPGRLVPEDTIKATPALLARQKKRESLQHRPDLRVSRSTRFRHQYDLEFVRKELAVGLLRTCTQVYDEAWRHWWSSNTFRFSHDTDWEGVRRFLTTVGPRVRKQLKQLQVLCSDRRLLRATEDQESVDCYWRHKNHPKMRWTKIVGTTIETENVDFVAELLKADGHTMLLQELQFVVPKGFVACISDYTLGAYSSMDMMPWLRHLIVIEEGAKIEIQVGWNEAGDMVKRANGMDLVCEQGAEIDNEGIKLPERITFPSVDSEDLPLIAGSKSLGLSDLFAEPESEPANTRTALGGRARRAKQKSMARVLKGFGGCRFERVKAWIFKDWDFAVNTIPTGWLESPERIKEVVFITVRKAKRARAHKMGIIQDPGLTVSSYGPW